MPVHTYRCENGAKVKLVVGEKDNSLKIACWKKTMNINNLFRDINRELHMETLRTKKSRTVLLSLDQGTITLTGNLNQAINLLLKYKGVTNKVYRELHNVRIENRLKELEQEKNRGDDRLTF